VPEKYQQHKGQVMTKTVMVLAAALMVGAMAHAADMENKGEATTDTSKNPITGTVTTTKKMHKKVKGAHGNTAEATVTQKTKVHKSGKVEKSETTDATTTEEPATK
jgi:hypothetical protein